LRFHRLLHNIVLYDSTFSSFLPTCRQIVMPTRHRHGVRQANTRHCRRHGLCRVGNTAPTYQHVRCFGGKKSPTRCRHFQPSCPLPHLLSNPLIVLLSRSSYVVSPPLIGRSLPHCVHSRFGPDLVQTWSRLMYMAIQIPKSGRHVRTCRPDFSRFWTGPDRIFT